LPGDCSPASHSSHAEMSLLRSGAGASNAMYPG
jgi:hypothetical protein